MTTLKLTRPLVSLDVETTGLSLTRDRIITLGLVKITSDGNIIGEELMFNPGIPIPASSTEIHGITDEMVKDSPRFEERADGLLSYLSGADYCGYNCAAFDVPMLHEHFVRAGKEWNVRDASVIDVGVLFQILEPRTLEAAVLKFCGYHHKDAHGAYDDALATFNVLNGMRAKYDSLSDSVQALAESSMREARLDLAGKIIVGKDLRPAFAFGERTKGMAVEDDYNNSDQGRSFAEWIIRNDFPTDTKRVLRGILLDIEEKQNRTTEKEIL